MASKIDVVKKVLTLIEENNIRDLGQHLTDDFQCSGPLPQVLNRDEFIRLTQSLVVAIPDWKYNATQMREEGDAVRFVLHVTGTNTGTVNLPTLGLRWVPSTGNCFALPAEPAEMIVRGRKIAAYTVHVDKAGGVAGILKQLGITPPEPAGVK